MDGGHQSILLIEDDLAVARNLQEGLRWEGFLVEWRPNGGR